MSLRLTPTSPLGGSPLLALLLALLLFPRGCAALPVHRECGHHGHDGNRASGPLLVARGAGSPCALRAEARAALDLAESTARGARVLLVARRDSRARCAHSCCLHVRVLLHPPGHSAGYDEEASGEASRGEVGGGLDDDYGMRPGSDDGDGDEASGGGGGTGPSDEHLHDYPDHRHDDHDDIGPNETETSHVEGAGMSESDVDVEGAGKGPGDGDAGGPGLDEGPATAAVSLSLLLLLVVLAACSASCAAFMALRPRYQRRQRRWDAAARVRRRARRRRVVMLRSGVMEEMLRRCEP
ncbi:unnamed protein product [Lampetra planeri]